MVRDNRDGMRSFCRTAVASARSEPCPLVFRNSRRSRVEKRLAFGRADSILADVRKTKIICTLGPASKSPETLRQMMHEGADVFRLNMSHAEHPWVREIVPRIRKIAADTPFGRHSSRYSRTGDPTGELKTDLQLKPGDIVEFTVRGAKSEEQYSVDVNYDGLINDISAGDTVLVDNGVVRLLVLRRTRTGIRCKVLTPGTLGSRRHINLPGVRVNLPPLTEKDLAGMSHSAPSSVSILLRSASRAADKRPQRTPNVVKNSAAPRRLSRRLKINRPSVRSTK